MAKRKMTRTDRMFYKVDRERLWEDQGRRCYHCKKPISRTEATMDHLIPISKIGGRRHNIVNCVASCFDCNQDKGDQLDWDVSQKQEQPIDWVDQMLIDFDKRINDRLRRFAWRMDMNPKGSYNKWLKYHQKRGEYLD